MCDENEMKAAVLSGISGGVTKSTTQVYEDVLQPSAKEIGTTLARAVHAALGPLRGMLWGYEQIEEYINTTVVEKLKNVPKERIITPDPIVAVPALQSLQYCYREEHLRHLYAQLLATSMDSQNASKAHPSFVEIIRNLASDEARIIKLFKTTWTFPVVTIRARTAKMNDYPRYPEVVIVRYYSHLCRYAECKQPGMSISYIDNLIRLGLLHHSSDPLAISGIYDELENDPALHSRKVQIDSDDVSGSCIMKRCYVEKTAFGDLFIEACVS